MVYLKHTVLKTLEPATYFSVHLQDDIMVWLLGFLGECFRFFRYFTEDIISCQRSKVLQCFVHMCDLNAILPLCTISISRRSVSQIFICVTSASKIKRGILNSSSQPKGYENLLARQAVWFPWFFWPVLRFEER